MTRYPGTYESSYIEVGVSPETIVFSRRESESVAVNENGFPEIKNGHYIFTGKNIMNKLGEYIPESEYEYSDGAYLGGKTTMPCSALHLNSMKTCKDVTIECYNIYISEDFDISSSNCKFIGYVEVYNHWNHMGLGD